MRVATLESPDLECPMTTPLFFVVQSQPEVHCTRACPQAHLIPDMHHLAGKVPRLEMVPMANNLTLLVLSAMNTPTRGCHCSSLHCQQLSIVHRIDWMTESVVSHSA